MMDREDLRMRILACLYAAPQQTADQEAILRAITRGGLGIARAPLRTEMAWLDQAGAVVNRSSGGVFIATITDTGCEHAEGRALIPDIRRPRPSEIAVT